MKKKDFEQIEPRDASGKTRFSRNPFGLRWLLRSGVFLGAKKDYFTSIHKVLLNREWEGKPETERKWERRYEQSAQFLKHSMGYVVGYDFFVKGITALDYPRICENPLDKKDGLKSQSPSLKLSPFDVLWLVVMLTACLQSWSCQLGTGLLQEYFSAEFFAMNPIYHTRVNKWVSRIKAKWPSIYLYGSLSGRWRIIWIDKQIIQQATSIKSSYVGHLHVGIGPIVDKADKEKFDITRLNLRNQLPGTVELFIWIDDFSIELCHFALRSSGRVAKRLVKLSASFASP